MAVYDSWFTEEYRGIFLHNYSEDEKKNEISAFGGWTEFRSPSDLSPNNGQTFDWISTTGIFYGGGDIDNIDFANVYLEEGHTYEFRIYSDAKSSLFIHDSAGYMFEAIDGDDVNYYSDSEGANSIGWNYLDTIVNFTPSYTGVHKFGVIYSDDSEFGLARLSIFHHLKSTPEPDIIAPTITFDPLPSLTNKTVIALTGTVEAGASIQIFYGESVLGVPIIKPDDSWILNVSLSEGVHSLAVQATDEAGNISQMSPRQTIEIDLTAPLLPLEENIMVNENTPFVMTVFTDPNEGDVYMLNGADAALFSLTMDGYLIFTTAPDYENSLDADHNNIYEVNVTAVDRAGNTSYLDIPVTVSNMQDTISAPFIIDKDDFNWNNNIDMGDGYFIYAEAAQLYRTYLGAMGRLPDIDGFNWWYQQISTGKHNLYSAADGFISSPEFKGYADTNFDNHISNHEFITHMYEGVFGRAPDQGGYEYWIDQLNSGASDQGEVLVYMTQSNEYIDQTLETVADYLFV